jgi:hypothetical protein
LRLGCGALGSANDFTGRDFLDRQRVQAGDGSPRRLLLIDGDLTIRPAVKVDARGAGGENDLVAAPPGVAAEHAPAFRGRQHAALDEIAADAGP